MRARHQKKQHDVSLTRNLSKPKNAVTATTHTPAVLTSAFRDHKLDSSPDFVSKPENAATNTKSLFAVCSQLIEHSDTAVKSLY